MSWSLICFKDLCCFIARFSRLRKSQWQVFFAIRLSSTGTEPNERRFRYTLRREWPDGIRESNPVHEGAGTTRRPGSETVVAASGSDQRRRRHPAATSLSRGCRFVCSTAVWERDITEHIDSPSPTAVQRQTQLLPAFVVDISATRVVKHFPARQAFAPRVVRFECRWRRRVAARFVIVCRK